jgi:hypothetical protein
LTEPFIETVIAMSGKALEVLDLLIRLAGLPDHIYPLVIAHEPAFILQHPVRAVREDRVVVIERISLELSIKIQILNSHR